MAEITYTLPLGRSSLGRKEARDPEKRLSKEKTSGSLLVIRPCSSDEEAVVGMPVVSANLQENQRSDFHCDTGLYSKPRTNGMAMSDYQPDACSTKLWVVWKRSTSPLPCDYRNWFGCCGWVALSAVFRMLRFDFLSCHWSAFSWDQEHRCI